LDLGGERFYTDRLVHDWKSRDKGLFFQLVYT